MGSLHYRCHFIKGTSAHCMLRLTTGIDLPATDHGIDIERVQFHPIANAAGALSRHKGGPTAKEGVEHNITTARAIEDGISDHGDRLYGRMYLHEVSLFGLP